MKAPFKALFLLAALVVLAGLAVSTFRTGPPASIELRTEATAIGPRTEVTARAVATGRGLASLRLEVEQKGQVWVVARHEHRPLPPWSFVGERVLEDELRADVGHQSLTELQEGEATIRVVAERARTWLLAPGPVTKELRLPVRRTPPSLSLVSTQHYVAQGGSGLVVYRVGPTAAADYVSAGAWRFPGRLGCRAGRPASASRSSACRGTSPTRPRCGSSPRTTPATRRRSPSSTATSASRPPATGSSSTTPS